MHRRTALIWLVTAGLIVLACLPAVVAFGLGWLRLPQIQPWGAPSARDTTSLEAWAAVRRLLPVLDGAASRC